MCRLRWNNFHFNEGVIHICEQVIIDKTNTYKDTLEDKIKRFKKEIDNYMQLPQISIHGLRHTHTTILLLKGENIKVISERLGHK